ncbi:CRISPR-associated protein Cas5 [Gelidibacter japonicus]|uniref:CRISPR-associated protein Cas5 n=1 Tax=Gelidibacter japonicus TaxID=1962232 RepID=UPI0013D59B01|nr:CRISPR-associated protein Cas5 [Gelidibacter japonicus]
MEILSFKIGGKMAHFRKYYANNTAFSFTIPPRTTLMGILAAAMGLPKDSYYEDLASEKINFGIRVLCPLKKSFHRLNFLSVKSIGDVSKHWSSDLRGENGRIQTPFEIITGWDMAKCQVEYQIFIAGSELGKDSFEKIKRHFFNNDPVFNISLGIANFNANISEIQLFNKNEITEIDDKDFIFMHSAVPVNIVEELKFNREEYECYNFIEEDMLPGDFVGNQNREVRKMNKLLFSITPNPIRVKLNVPYYQLDTESGKLNIQFMDI